MLYRFFLFSLFRFAHPNPVFPYFFELFSRSILFPAFPLAPIFDFDVTQILNLTCRNILHTRSNFIENEKIKKKSKTISGVGKLLEKERNSLRF